MTKISQDQIEKAARDMYLAHRPRNKGWLVLGAWERQNWIKSARAAAIAFGLEVEE